MTQDSAVLDASGAMRSIELQLVDSIVSTYYFLMSPELFFYEIGNVCWKNVRFSRWSEEIAMAYFTQSLNLTELQSRLERTSVYEIAKRYSLSFYDASYLSLALETQSDLISFDKKLNKAATKAGVGTFF